MLDVVVMLLLDRGSTAIDRATDGGTTPLYAACQNGHVEVVEFLSGESSAAVNQGKTSDGTTPLLIACQNGLSSWKATLFANA